VNYQLWRLEEHTGRKAILENSLSLKLIELLKKPLPSYLEDMDAAGCFVDVDVPARPAGVPDGDGEFTTPKAISRFLTGLTPEGDLFDKHGENSQEKDFSFLQDVYGGVCILLKESETLKGGVDDLCLVLRIRIKLLLEYTNL
jgi:hypothetical protein